MELKEQDNYDGVDDVEVNQDTGKDETSSLNPLNLQNAQNPYYEGDFELSSMTNEASRKNVVYPDLNATEIVTATQNVYYELWWLR